MTVKEIDKKITELKNMRYEAEKKEILEFKKTAITNVGRCFIANGVTYVKVIDIPREEPTMTGFNFNKYQYPALFLGNKKSPFRFGTLFSAAWGEGANLLDINYKEISREEFEIKFHEIIESFRNSIIEL